MSAFGKKLGIGLVIGVGTMGILAGGLWGVGSQISGSGDKIESWRQALSDRLSLSRSFASLRSQYDNQAKDYLSFLERTIPNEDGLIDFSKSLQFLANQEGVELGFQFSGDPAPASDVSLGNIPFHLSLKGGFDRIMNFVAKLDRFRFLLTTENLDLSLVGNSYSGTLNGRVFFR